MRINKSPLPSKKHCPKLPKWLIGQPNVWPQGEGLFISGPEPAAVSECWIRWNARRLSGSVRNRHQPDGGRHECSKASGAEDSRELAEKDLKEINVSGKDIVIGIASSGRTPYVLGGIAYAKEQGALTACITSSANSPLEKMVDLPIVCLTGPEVITGSTRMKSGTAQKMICNMISTSTMIKLGKVYSNFMVDVMATNEKLVARSLKIITDITGLSSGDAETMLKKHKTIKKVVFAYLTGIEQDEIIEQYLTKNQGHLRKSVEDAKCNMLK